VARKKGRATVPGRPYVDPPKTEPITVDRSAEEGLLIARSALMLEVKNRIIVGALRDDEPFDRERVRDLITTELVVLAEEYAESERRLSHLADDSLHAVDGDRELGVYGPRDYTALTKRSTVSAAMARALRGYIADAPFLDELVDEARDRAWADVGAAIAARLEAMAAPEMDEWYETDRETRLAAFLAINLAPLLRGAKAD
jgi:hypothetical protein